MKKKMFLNGSKCSYWLNVLLAALNCRLALHQQPDVSQPFFLPSSLFRRQAPPPQFIQPSPQFIQPPPQFIQPAANIQPVGLPPPGDPRFQQNRAPVQQLQASRAAIDQSRRPAPAPPVLRRPRPEPTTTVLTAKQSSKSAPEKPPVKANAPPLAKPIPSPPSLQISLRPVQVAAATRAPSLSSTPPLSVLQSPARRVPPASPQLALLQFPPGKAPPPRQQTPAQISSRTNTLFPQQPQNNRPPPTQLKNEKIRPPLEQVSQNLIVQKEAAAPAPTQKIGPPSFAPPSNSVVEELNNAENFLAVAERLQLRSLAFVGKRRVLAKRAKRHSDFILKRQALFSPSIITAQRHSNSEDLAELPETTIQKTVNMSGPINVPSRLQRKSELDVKAGSTGILPLTTIKHTNTKDLGGIPLKMISKTVWKMPLTMTVQQKIRIVPKGT